MILKYMGHAFFTMTLESGTTIVFDPYGDFYSFPKRRVQADICLMSHHHHDHDGVQCIAEGAQMIDATGVTKAKDVKIIGVPTCHDEVQGAKRGPNTFYVIEAEGLRIGHAGDLGHVPTAEQVRQIGRLDVLMLPVGGFYTIDCETAVEVCRLLQPVTMIPMHYRTQYDEDMPISPLKDFLALVKAEDTQMPLVRIVKEDVLERPQVITLAIQPE